MCKKGLRSATTDGKTENALVGTRLGADWSVETLGIPFMHALNMCPVLRVGIYIPERFTVQETNIVPVQIHWPMRPAGLPGPA